MKINELFNNDPHGVDHKEEKAFDLDDDLIYYMHNNDDVYRNNFFPIVHACHKTFKSGKAFGHRVFKPAVLKSYEMYKKEFPVRELEDELDEEMCDKICKKIHEQELKNMREGLYK
jgi:hypothetical protein